MSWYKMTHGRLRAILDWIEDIAYGLFISFYTPKSENKPGNDNEG